MNGIESFSSNYEKWKTTYFKAGTSVTASVPFMSYEPRKIHIDHVFDSFYEGRQLIVYRVYGKTRQWWHEFMCDNTEMCSYIDRAKREKSVNPTKTEMKS